MQSLHSRLWVLIALLIIAGAAAGGLMIGLFYQSASAQAGEAEAQIARACDSIASTYRFYSTDWRGPSTALHDAALRTNLTTVVQTALRDRPGIEGGLWEADAGSLAYAYPTYQGTGPKTDMPQAEGSRIKAINAAALTLDRPTTQRYRASTQVLLMAACPLRGPIPQLTAWTMTRVVTFAGRAYEQLMAGLGVLLVAIAAATVLLLRLAVTWSRHVARIEKALEVNQEHPETADHRRGHFWGVGAKRRHEIAEIPGLFDMISSPCRGASLKTNNHLDDDFDPRK